MSQEICNRIERAYSERNFTAVLAVVLAIRLGLSAGKGIDDNEDWDDEWRNVVYINLPGGGQLSWHIAPGDLSLLDDIPLFEGGWDGTFVSRDAASGAALLKAILDAKS